MTKPDETMIKPSKNLAIEIHLLPTDLIIILTSCAKNP